MALMKLQGSPTLSSQFEELLFWGKITGLYGDYYIAVGYTYTGVYEFPNKRFYWAVAKQGQPASEMEFNEMPELND